MVNFPERLKFLRKEKRYARNKIAGIFGLNPRCYQEYGYQNVCPAVPGLIQIVKYFDVSTVCLPGPTDKQRVNG